MSQDEPRNPLYFLLLLVGMVFIVTVLAYAIVPTLEDKAREAGAQVPPSPWRKELKENGWRWVLGEVGLLVVVSLMCMGLDRYRRWQRERDQPSDSGTTKVDS